MTPREDRPRSAHIVRGTMGMGHQGIFTVRPALYFWGSAARTTIYLGMHEALILGALEFKQNYHGVANANFLCY